MEDEFKFRYACPSCGTKVRLKSGHCPKCGFIGPMIHKDIRLRATDVYGRTVTVNPPTVPQDTENQGGQAKPDTASSYKCPRCGARTRKEYGNCPNRKSCGYVGRMQSSPRSKTKQ